MQLSTGAQPKRPTRLARRTSVASLFAITLLSWTVFGAATDTRLLDAARRDDLQAVRELIERKVDVDLRQPDGATALHWAAHWNNLAMADLLIRAGAAVN